MTLNNYIVSLVIVVGFKGQRKPKFCAKIFLSAEIPFPLKGNRNRFLRFRFRSSRNRKHKTDFGFNRNFGRNIVLFEP